MNLAALCLDLVPLRARLIASCIRLDENVSSSKGFETINLFVDRI